MKKYGFVTKNRKHNYFKDRPRFLTDFKFQQKIIKKFRKKDKKIIASVTQSVE